MLIKIIISIIKLTAQKGGGFSEVSDDSEDQG